MLMTSQLRVNSKVQFRKHVIITTIINGAVTVIEGAIFRKADGLLFDCFSCCVGIVMRIKQLAGDDRVMENGECWIQKS